MEINMKALFPIIGCLVFFVLLSVDSGEAQSPSPTATPNQSTEFPIPDYINSEALLLKVPASRRASASSEFKALNEAFDKNARNLTNFIRAQNDWSNSAVRSPTVQNAFFSNYRAHVQLVERQINLFSKYGLLPELKMRGKTLAEIISNFRTDIADIVKRDKVFEIQRLTQVAQVRELNTFTDTVALILDSIGPVSAYASEVTNGNSVTTIVRSKAQTGCDGKIYYTNVVYTHLNSNSKRVIDEDYSFVNCELKEGVPQGTPELKRLFQRIDTEKLCANSEEFELTNKTICTGSGRQIFAKNLFHGLASGCGCRTKEDRFDQSPIPVCAYVRYSPRDTDGNIIPHLMFTKWQYGGQSNCQWQDPLLYQ